MRRFMTCPLAWLVVVCVTATQVAAQPQQSVDDFFDSDGPYETHLQNGEREEAAALAAEHLKQWVPGVIEWQQSEQLEYFRGGIDRFLDAIARDELVDMVAEHARPADEADAEDWRVYAGICETLLKWDQARQVYEQLVEQEPNVPSHRIRLAMMTAHDDVEAATEHLLKVRMQPDRWGLFGSEIAKHLHGMRLVDYDRMLSLIEMVSQ